METLISAVPGDPVSRSIALIVDKCSEQATVEDNLRRLHQLLLRIRAAVEEAEGRRVTNQGMIHQLRMTREQMFRGYYLLDAFKLREKKANDGEVSNSFALSKFNPSKRFRRLSSNTRIQNIVVGIKSSKELKQIVHGLESNVADMKEFVILLISCPPMHCQPYGTYLFLDKCMFGRQMEREQIISFLLQAEPLGNENLGALPVVGPAQVGKSTPVENVCNDETVRNHFSLILFYSGNDLKDEEPDALESRVIKHQNHASHGRSLVVIELFRDVDKQSWGKFYSSKTCLAHGSKIIVTGRSDNIASFGTTEALRLKPLPREAYWYFFKELAFGRTDAEEHPKLKFLAMELANELKGSLLYAYIIGGVLRASFNTQCWCWLLQLVREYMRKNLSLFGEYPGDVRMKNLSVHTWRIATPLKHFSLYEIYQEGHFQDKIPQITMQDLLSKYGAIRGKLRSSI